MQPSRTPFIRKLVELFGVDLRSLGVLRVAIALVILLDLMQRSRDLVAHYTDFGVLPRAALIANEYTRWHLSIHLMNGTWEVQAVLFGIAAIFALLLLVGYQTRRATIVCWFFLLSVRNRNTVIWADALLSDVLFWGMFLPWGARFSVDKVLHPAWDKLPDRYLSWGTAAYVMQIAFVFWFGALWKSGPEWRVDGTAVYYALSVDQLATPFGLFLLQFPLVLKVLSFGVFWFEILAPLLLISPVWTGPIRTATIFGLIFMFFGFGLCLVIGIFVWIAIAAVIGLLPFWCWEKMNGWWQRTDGERITIYYDQDCGFCRTAIRVIGEFLPSGSAITLPAQSHQSIEADLRLHDSWVVMDKRGDRHYGFRAALAIGKQSYLLWPVVLLLKSHRIVGIGESIYRRIAKQRKMHCSLEGAKALAPVPAYELGWMGSLLIAILLLYVFLWNVAGLPSAGLRMSERFYAIGQILGLEQRWAMFAPAPLKNDGWYVIPGKLKNGKEVDLFRNGEEITWAKPMPVSATYKDVRWQKYMMNLWGRDFAKYRPFYAQYLCRDWNARHSADTQLEELRIYFLMEVTLPNYEYFTPEKVLMLTHRCTGPSKN